MNTEAQTEWDELLSDKESDWSVFMPSNPDQFKRKGLLGDGELFEWAHSPIDEARHWRIDLQERIEAYQACKADFDRETSEEALEAEWAREIQWAWDRLKYEDGEIPDDSHAAYLSWLVSQMAYIRQERSKWKKVDKLLKAEEASLRAVEKTCRKKAGKRALLVIFGYFLFLFTCIVTLAGMLAYNAPESALGTFCRDWVLTPLGMIAIVGGYVLFWVTTSGLVMWVAAAFGVVLLGMLGNYWAMVLFESRRPRM